MTKAISLQLILILAGVGPGFAEGKKTDLEKSAVEKPAKTDEVKERKLADLVQTALNSGHRTTIDKVTSKNLGLGKKRTKVRALRYSSDVAPDGKNHLLKVLFREDADKTLHATSLVFQVTKRRVMKKGTHLDARGYRFSPNGTLIGAVKVKGYVGRIKQTRLSPKSSRVKKAFKKELAFWLEDTAEIEFER